MGRGPAAEFAAASPQFSAALNYPGTIKAFHFHLHQTDCWTPAKGLLQVVLADLRIGSRTFGLRNTMYVGVLRPWQAIAWAFAQQSQESPTPTRAQLYAAQLPMSY